MTIEIEGFKTFQRNRKAAHIRATGGSGGVAFLVKTSLYETFEIKCHEQYVDGILHLPLVDKWNIISVYMPPDTSSHAEDNDRMFQLLVEALYELSESSDFTMICGNLNARVGTKPDYIDTVDEVTPRVSIDQVCNDQGTSLVNMCLQTNTCIVNGRITPLLDGFTLVLHRGTAVVVYMISPHDHLSQYQ